MTEYLGDEKIAQSIDAVDEDDEVSIGGKRADQAAEVSEDLIVAG